MLKESNSSNLKSLRLVYDRDKTTFKGTAFIDFFDEESFKVCLEKGNGSTLLGRYVAKLFNSPLYVANKLCTLPSYTGNSV